MFIYKYGRTHHLATGIKANNETHPSSIASFITALEPKLNRMVTRKFADAMNKPEMLQDVFTLAEKCAKKMQEWDFYERPGDFRLPSIINEICNTEVNEVAQGHWNNQGSSNYGNRYNDKKSWGNQDNYKGKNDFNKKPWQGKEQKPWNKDHKSSYGKESKPKDACITLTKDVKYFFPTGYDEGIFNTAAKLLHEKVEQAKKSGSDNVRPSMLLNVKASVISLKFQNNYMMQHSHRWSEKLLPKFWDPTLIDYQLGTSQVTI